MNTKKIILLLPLLFLCSCEIFGWDSSGGVDIVTPIPSDLNDEQIEMASAPNDFFVVSSQVQSTTSSTDDDDIVSLPTDSLDSTSDLENISNEDALIVAYDVCDDTAISIESIDLIDGDAIITWTNQASEVSSLSITNDIFGPEGLRAIECLNL